MVLFSGARTGAQPPQKTTSSANYRNRVNFQRDRAGASSDDEQQQVLQQIYSMLQCLIQVFVQCFIYFCSLTTTYGY